METLRCHRGRKANLGCDSRVRVTKRSPVGLTNRPPNAGRRFFNSNVPETKERIYQGGWREKCMHHILLIFFLFLIFCGPLAVIRTALGCGTLVVLAAILIALICWVAKLNQPDPDLPAARPGAAVYQYQQRWIDRQTAPRAEPILLNHPAQEWLLESAQAAPRAVLVGPPNEHTRVRVMRAELVKLPSGGNQ
jgi:hypothetical protein